MRALRLSSHAAEKQLGISGAQLFVLRALAEEPGLSLGELAAQTLTDPSSVSVVAAKLVERGLLIQKQDPADRRRRVLSLSARGKKLLARAPEPVQVQLVAALRALPMPCLRALGDSLGELVRAIGADGARAPMFFSDEPKKPVRRG